MLYSPEHHICYSADAELPRTPTFLGPLSITSASLSRLLLLSPAAVFENLDSSDVMETPAFPFAMKLLEVLDPLSLLVWILVAKTLRA